MFYSFADRRTKKVELRNVLFTSSAIGLDKLFGIIFKAIFDLNEQYHDEPVDFETFIKDLTMKLGNPYDEKSRRNLWQLIDKEEKESIDANEILLITNQLGFHLNDAEVKEIILIVGGPEVDNISYEKFEAYLARKALKPQPESELPK